MVRSAGRAWYDTLISAGVRVYEWRPTTLHAKTFVVDGQWSTVGSMNFDNRSMALNDESTLMVLSHANLAPFRPRATTETSRRVPYRRLQTTKSAGNYRARGDDRDLRIHGHSCSSIANALLQT